MSLHEPPSGEASLVKAEADAAPPAAVPEAEGALVVALRWPVRVVVLLVVVPVRVVWDALVVCGWALHRTVWEPFARAMAWLGRTALAPVARALGVALVWLAKALCVWPWVGLWRYLLVPVGRGLGAARVWFYRCVLAPVGRGVAAAVVWLYRWVLAPVGHGVAAVVYGIGVALAWLGRTLVVLPARWIHRSLLAPLGNGVAAAAVWLYLYVLTPAGRGAVAVIRGLWTALVWLAKALCVWPWVGLWRYLLVPVGRGLGLLGRVLIVIPAVAVCRYVLMPVGRVLAVPGREIADAAVICWRLAGRVSRAVFGFLGRVLRLLFVEPVVWVWRHVLAPVGRGLRDHVWCPATTAARSVGRTVRATVASARASVRQARADVRRALFGGPRAPGENS